MKLISIILGAAIILMVAMPTVAEEGRFQAIPLTTSAEGGSAVFIIDTREGHLWMWGVAIRADKPELTTGLWYHGQVRPGKKPGECIYKYPLQ